MISQPIKVAPALAAGNTVVVKPPEVNSLSLLRLGELAAEAGLPAGYLHVVTGGGSKVGNPIVDHDDIALITFTGRAGRSPEQ